MPDDPRHPTPSRLVLARMRRGLLGWQVADQINVTRRRWSLIERGAATPTNKEMAAAANLLRFPVEFFYRPHIDIPTIEMVN